MAHIPLNEANEQTALFHWAAFAAKHEHPELALMFAVPNGGHRHPVVAAKLKAQGVKAGVTGRPAEVRVPNPVILAPYRSFPEIAQVESRFVFRIRGGESITMGLFEADGGMWRVEAIARVRNWLRERCSEINIIA